jgi:hypothetical protein
MGGCQATPDSQERDTGMGDKHMAARNRRPKHFRLNPAKIKRAQRILNAAAQTEAIDRALESVISNDEANRLVNEANERFVKSGIDIKDVYGVLAS